MKNINNTTVGVDLEPKTKFMDGMSKTITADYTATIEDIGSVIVVQAATANTPLITLPSLSDYNDSDGILVKGVPFGSKITVVLVGDSGTTGGVEIEGAGTDGIAGVFRSGTQSTGIADGVTDLIQEGSMIELVAAGATVSLGTIDVWMIGHNSGNWGITGS